MASTNPQVVAVTAVKQPTNEELLARIAQLEAERDAAKNKAFGELGFKVGDKGGIMITGLGRFPTTLYFEQWERVIQAIPRLVKFMADNKHLCSMKVRN